MSSFNMVANIILEKDKLKGLPVFDTTNEFNWSKRLKMWLMRKRRNHLGLEDRPERPPNNAAAATLGLERDSATLRCDSLRLLGVAAPSRTLRCAFSWSLSLSNNALLNIPFCHTPLPSLRLCVLSQQ